MKVFSEVQVLNVLHAILIACLASGCVREKDRLDEEVRQLCAEDGGVRIFERVSLSSNRFDKTGFINFYHRTSNDPLGSEFIFESHVEYYRKGNPEMWKNLYRVIRRADGKVLGQSISYSRRGGDLPGPWHESSFGCPKNSGDVELLRQVFVKSSE